MFTGMIRVENQSKTLKTDTDSPCHRCAVRTGGVSLSGAPGIHRRRSFRRPGHMRTELENLEEAAGATRDSQHPRTATENTQPSSEQWLKEAFKTHRLPVEEGNSRDVFNSSFSFIQQSLETSDLLDASVNNSPKSERKRSESTSWRKLKFETSNSGSSEHHLDLINLLSQSEASTVPISQSEDEVFTLGHLPHSIGRSVSQKGLLLDRELWLVDLDVQASSSMAFNAKESIQDSDSVSLDAEATSSLSIDSSDSTSASSVTSGYESTTTSSDQSRDGPMKKYEDVLQDCLQNNRANNKIESMMMKLERLQHKAVLDDDYDTAERFSKKLEELRRERASLKPGLPSTRSEVTLFLERLRTAVNGAIHRTDTDCSQNGELIDDQGSNVCQSRAQTREKLLEEKQRIQEEVCELQRRLQELQERSRSLDLQLELEEIQGPVPKACDPARLLLTARALQDMMTSEHRRRISSSPPPHITTLQEQERALSLSIREATAKVVLGQRLSGRLRRKVSESETQLLALHQAKLTAISGKDFSSAKELNAEMKSVLGERERLDGLLKKLQMLSAGGGRDLSRMKQQQSRTTLELQERVAQFEHSLKENTLKYIELLEERLHSCGSAALELIYEADLEACHLLLKGLHQRKLSVSETEDRPASDDLPFSKEEADCAMLTALGGRWCPEADLQHSEFTKKLEEFLFCLEDASPEDLCGETEELTERCELISDRLHHLEEQLQSAIDNHNQDLTLSLEKEVQEVKASLQAMLSQLKEEDEEDEELFCDEEEEQVDEEDLDEEHYFSDSWEI